MRKNHDIVVHNAFVSSTLNILFKRLDPEFQYWISLIFPKNSVLVAPRGLLFFKPQISLMRNKKHTLRFFYTGTAISRSSPSGIFWPNWTSGSWYLAVSSDFRRTILLVYFLVRRSLRRSHFPPFDKNSILPTFLPQTHFLVPFLCKNIIKF